MKATPRLLQIILRFSRRCQERREQSLSCLSGIAATSYTERYGWKGLLLKLLDFEKCPLQSMICAHIIKIIRKARVSCFTLLFDGVKNKVRGWRLKVNISLMSNAFLGKLVSSLTAVVHIIVGLCSSTKPVLSLTHLLSFICSQANDPNKYFRRGKQRGVSYDIQWSPCL